MQIRSRAGFALFSFLFLGAAGCGGQVAEVEAPADVEAPQEQAEVEQDLSQSLDGVSTQIKVTRNARGVPHVTSSSEAGAYFGLCYAMAEDRLFHMDLMRRSAQGRLAEIFGAAPDGSVLQQDLLFRTLGLASRGAQGYARASTRTRTVLKQCASGVNDYLAKAKRAGTLSPEFAALGYVPEAWTPADSFTLGTFLSSSLSLTSWQMKLQTGAIAALVSPEVAQALVPVAPEAPSVFNAAGKLNPPQSFVVTALPPGNTLQAAPRHWLKQADVKDAKGLARLPHRSAAVGQLGGHLSNAFAVDGTRTASRKPLLASDPHLGMTTPTIAYLARMTVKGGFDLEGVTVSGLPMFLSARAGEHAWGVTLALIDDVDLYVEQLRGTSPTQEAFVNGAWVPVKARTEQVLVAGGAPVSLLVQTTPHGPLLGNAIPELNAFGDLALKATVLQPQWGLDGFFEMPTAKKWKSFQSAARSVGLGLNWHFADNSGATGHIGYALGGLAPQRNLENAASPVPGFDGLHEWTGYAPASALPSVYNPPSHLLVTANNRLVPSNYAPGGKPVYISNFYDMPWRAQRITTRLVQGPARFSAETLASVQLDTKTVNGPVLRDAYVAALSRTGLPAGDSSAAASLAALRAWDGDAAPESRGAAVYETLTAVLLKNMALGVLGPELYAGYAPTVFYAQQLDALQRQVLAPSAPFFGATSPGDAAAARDAAVRDALAEADARLRETLGENVATWTWGGIHTLTYNHPLAAFDPAFELGTFPARGDVGTVWLGGWFAGTGALAQGPEAGGLRAAFAQDAWQISRTVWSLSSRERSLGVLATGERGSPGPYFGDQAAAWRAGKYFSLGFATKP